MSVYDLQGMADNNEIVVMNSGWSVSCCNNDPSGWSGVSVSCHASFV